ncbi:MAG: phosphoribosylglycinamide formyltransferase [Clostridiales bacterium]|nr:phosphoribosylglycinamide formyltransferase [Clostridiales bacterium]
MKRVAVLVSGGGTNLQALIDSRDRGELGENCTLSLVLSSASDVYALERAKKAGIPSIVVERKGKKRETFTRKVIEALLGNNIDLVVLAGFMCIMGPEFTKVFENRVINVHPALIPSFCGDGFYGLKVHEKALEYGVKVSGATVHFVNEITDGGPIIAQKALEVRDDDTPETLQRRIMEQCEWRLLPVAVRLFCDGRLAVEGRKVYIKKEENI